MVKKEEAVTETAQNAGQAQNVVKTEEIIAETQNIDSVDVPEAAEEISQEEALAAANEVNRLRKENTEIKQQLAEIKIEIPEEKVAQMRAEILENLKAEFSQNLEAAAKENAELKEKLAAVEKVVEEKDKQLEAAAKTSGSNAFYIDFLNKLEEKFNNYSGIRRERLRNEFITDIKEEIQRQKDLLTNA